jgi:hypothetical protein
MKPATHTLITVLLNIGILYVIYLFFIQRRVEGFTNPPLVKNNNILTLPAADGGSLCTQFANQPQLLNEKCGSLTEKNCNVTSCCVWLNGTSCVAGNSSGPTFRTTKGKPIDVKTYSYQNTTL